MERQEKENLIDLLKKFFDEYDINDKYTTSKNPVARYLKKKLVSLGRWKNLPRGEQSGLIKIKQETMNK